MYIASGSIEKCAKIFFAFQTIIDYSRSHATLIFMRIYKHILSIIVSVAIAAAGLPVYAGTGCSMNTGVYHMMKDCPDCVEKSENQEQHKNKCCGDIGCAVNCSSAISLNMPIGMNAVLMSVTLSAHTLHPANDAVMSFSLQTQERPPKHLS